MSHILIAKNENDQLIHLTDSYSRQDLLSMRNRHTFTCPDCGSFLYLKVGDIKVPHFAHKSISDCESHSEPESPLHLKGKIVLHEFFATKRIPVEVEKYLPEIRQRADLLVNGFTAIEFQCSPIPAQDVLRRTAAYTGIGVTATWIVGIRENLRNSIQIIRLMEWQKEMLLNQNLSAHLMMLNPENRNFHYYSNLFYISGNRWVGKVRILPVEKQTYPFAVPKMLNRADFEIVCSIFSKAKGDWIRSQLFARNRYQNPFWLLCYHLGFDMRNLPETIGVPIPRSECITEHATVWQLKIVQALNKGQNMEGLLSSKQIKLHRKAKISDVKAVLEKYVCFYREMESAKPCQERMNDQLYDIYCKSVRKLRK